MVIFWLLSGIMTFMQTVIGVSLAKFTGIDPLLGILAGSVSMSDGNGSARAFGVTGAFLIDIFQMPVIITAINMFSK